MSLETAADARRVHALSRAEYELQVAYLEQLPPEGWTEQSACRDWQVYQVVSHIGSQPEITGAVLRAGVRGEPPMTDEERRAIWDRFDNYRPDEVFPAYRANNEAWYRLVDSFSEEELGQTIQWFAGPMTIAGMLASRLNEQALHTWDIRWARDRNAKLTPEVVSTLIEGNLAPFRVKQLTRVEAAPRLSGHTIQLHLRDPEGAVHFILDPDGAQARQGNAAPVALSAELPAEGFVRLIWGRYDVRLGLASGELKLSDDSLADELQALFPGR
jgi:uncharacterized protein (TIGR03083 family)